MKRILILAATTGYQTRVFEEAARSLGLEPVMATDRCRHLDDPWGDGASAVRFHQPDAGLETLARLDPPPDGVIAAGDKPAELAALVAQHFGLPYHSPAAVALCRNKHLMRERFDAAGLLVPEHFLLPVRNAMLGEAIRSVRFPCVLKPLGLSASRGVIRADDEPAFYEAFERIAAILEQPDIARLHEDRDRFIQVEDYIPGREFALEGLVTDGKLKTLALFDKPDPLEGPFFEETIYVTPSREPDAVQEAIRTTTQRAVTALGLTNGPAHAEMRLNQQGVWMLEVAARPIGGLCAQAVRFGVDGATSLEHLLIRFAVGEDVTTMEREPSASGVMMIPVPKSGVLHRVEGVTEAEAVPCIMGVEITAKEGHRLLRLPEGSGYPGFLFARADTPEMAEAALREAHRRLRFEIHAELPALRPGN
jgi:biotin carboxylase